MTSVPSHRANIAYDFLKEKLGKRSIKHTEWPPFSPVCNPLGYDFWEKIKQKVYDDQFNQLVENSNKLKRKIKSVLPEVAHDLTKISKDLKQLTPRLKAIKEKKGQSVEMLLG